jgi:hypothetical protein
VGPSAYEPLDDMASCKCCMQDNHEASGL